VDPTWTTEWKLFRVRYASDVWEWHVARSADEVRATIIDLVGPDDEQPQTVTEWDPGAAVALRGDEGERLTFRADEWAASTAKATCIASTEV